MDSPEAHSHSPAARGYILLADISGFEPYLAGVELDHAQGVVTELLELLTRQLTPPMHLASLEGDGILAYAPEGRLLRGESLLELSESAYVAFKDRLKAIHRNTTCDCQACQAVPSLDLKFLVHFGEYVAQDGPAESTSLGGLAVTLVRDRLIKDQVGEGENTRAYILLTEQSLEQMGVRPEGLARQAGEYPHHGRIQTARLDLQPRYEALTAARRAYVPVEEADLVLEQDFPVPAPVLWDWLNDPVRRTQWNRLRTWTAALRPGGRTGVGARNHCAHGLGVIQETVQDWRPFDYYTVIAAQDSLRFAVMQTYQLEPLAGGAGTRLRMATRLQEPTPEWYGRPLVTQVARRVWKQDLRRLAAMIAAGQGEDSP